MGLWADANSFIAILGMYNILPIVYFIDNKME